MSPFYRHLINAVLFSTLMPLCATLIRRAAERNSGGIVLFGFLLLIAAVHGTALHMLLAWKEKHR